MPGPTMNDPAPNPYGAILLAIAERAPYPWYPSSFVRAKGILRRQLDLLVDELWLGGFIHLTAWVEGREQGFVLTADGIRALRDPSVLTRLPPKVHGLKLPTPSAVGTLHGAGPLGPPLPQASPPPVEQPSSAADPLWRRREEVRKALQEPGKPVVTWIILSINILVFLFGLFLAYRARVVTAYLLPFDLRGMGPVLTRIWEQSGAVSGTQLLQGEWWRLLTSCFVHIGVLHLIVNMYSLFAIGPLLERLWGRWRFLALYLIAGFGGSCALVMENPILVGAGASGALWGIVASMAAWLVLNRRALPRDLVAEWRRQLVMVFLLNVTITFAVPFISKGAHFGGALVGLLAAVPLHYQRHGRGWRRWLAVGVAVAVPALCAVGLARTMAVSERWLPLVQKDEQHQLLEYQQRVDTIDVVAQRAYDLRVRRLFDMHPERRLLDDPDAVAKAIETLTRQRDELAEAASLYAHMGPFRSPEVEETRLAGQRYFEEKARWYEMARTYLEEDKKSDDAFAEQRQHVSDLRTRWRMLREQYTPQAWPFPKRAG